MALTLEIVTPEARVYSDTVDSVVIPTIEGEIGVLPGHLPLLTQVDQGDIRAQKGGTVHHLAVEGGFAQIVGNKVSILAEHAIEESKIDPDAVEKAMARAQEALRAKETLEPTEVERLESVVRFAVAQLGVKRRR